ncbi:hypothetical protein, partial [Mycobacterium avium]|uniref:hypothetical protein n=1 Tax=Mycobacterium avium TaxID=1764 RepID=UPI001CC48F10
MAPTATQGTTHGVELASGYIALSVKYGSSMSQIHKDFRGVEEQAHTSGLVAGRNIGSGIAKGAEDGAKKGRTATKRELALAEADAKTSGAKIGSALSRGIQAPVAAAAHAARVSLVG